MMSDTSRVVLNILGVSDFGIYNVVGSIVTLFSFINGSMSLATSRFLTVEIGKEDKQGYKTNFRVSLLLHVVIAVAIFVITEITTIINISNNDTFNVIIFCIHNIV